jgi:hypothetical protein
MDDVIASRVDGYSDTYTTYKINILTQWEIVVSKDVIFEEDMRSSNSHDSPLVIEEREEVDVPKTNSKT